MFNSKDIDVVNIVASGKFDVELDLGVVAQDLCELDDWISEVKHSQSQGNRLLIYFVDNDALCILTSSGVYMFNGIDTYEEIEDVNEKLLKSLSQLEIISSRNPSEEEVVEKLSIRNMVCTVDLGREVNLNAVSIGLGFENIEYEPEQFPGLVYRPQDQNCTILIFSTGKILIMGVQNEKSVREAFELITSELEEM
jgi:transcription initiation factor TFIID TATA-box-binding protein